MTGNAKRDMMKWCSKILGNGITADPHTNEYPFARLPALFEKQWSLEAVMPHGFESYAFSSFSFIAPLLKKGKINFKNKINNCLGG